MIKLRLRLVFKLLEDETMEEKYIYMVPDGEMSVKELLTDLVKCFPELLEGKMVELYDSMGFKAPLNQPVRVFDDLSIVYVHITHSKIYKQKQSSKPAKVEGNEKAHFIDSTLSRKPKSDSVSIESQIDAKSSFQQTKNDLSSSSVGKGHFKFTEDGTPEKLGQRLDAGAEVPVNIQRAKRSSHYSFTSSAAEVVDSETKTFVEKEISKHGQQFFAPRTLKSVGIDSENTIQDNNRYEGLPPLLWKDVSIGQDIAYCTLSLEGWSPVRSDYVEARITKIFQGKLSLKLNLRDGSSICKRFDEMIAPVILDKRFQKSKKRKSFPTLPSELRTLLERRKQELKDQYL